MFQKKDEWSPPDQNQKQFLPTVKDLATNFKLIII
jgi:hypothetical protein